MKKNLVLKNAFSMPLTSPSYPKGPYYFENREFLVITYETDIDVLKEVVPEPLEVTESIVKFEFIRMPNSTGFGDYSEAGQVIPVRYKGKSGGYVYAMYLDNEAPIAGGREIWGFPKKLANPKLSVSCETLVGSLSYENTRVALATMGYKYEKLDNKKIFNALMAPNYLLKIIPHVDGKPRICELVEYKLANLKIKGAWSGPAALHLVPHAMAPVYKLPVRRVISAAHILTDLILPYGKVVFDYIKSEKK